MKIPPCTMRPKPKVGETLFAARNGRHNHAEYDCAVTKVGNKYFAIKEIGGSDAFPRSEDKIRLDTWSNGDPNFETRVYLSRIEWAETVEAKAIAKGIGRAFEYGRIPNNLSIETLRKIQALIEL